MKEEVGLTEEEEIAMNAAKAKWLADEAKKRSDKQRAAIKKVSDAIGIDADTFMEAIGVVLS